MDHEETCSYKGHLITTQCCDAGGSSSGRTVEFTASFRVVLPGAYQSSWQEFPRFIFGSCIAAAANAVLTAKASIDDSLTPRLSHSMGR